MKSYYSVAILAFIAILAVTKGFPQAKEEVESGQLISKRFKFGSHDFKHGGFPQAKEEVEAGQLIGKRFKFAGHDFKHGGNMIKDKKNWGPLKKWIPPLHIAQQVTNTQRENDDIASKQWVPPPLHIARQVSNTQRENDDTTSKKWIRVNNILKTVAKEQGMNLLERANAVKKWIPPPVQLLKKEETTECDEMYDAVQAFLDEMFDTLSDEEIAADEGLESIFGEDYDMQDPADVKEISCILVALGENPDLLPEEERENFEQSMKDFSDGMDILKPLLDQGLLDGTEYYDFVVAMVDLHDVFVKYGLIQE